jgi:hypothetical protein
MIINSFLPSIFSVFGRIERTLSGLLGTKAATWERVASTGISFLHPIINTVLILEFGPGIESEVSSVLTTVQNDLIAAQHLTVAIGPTPTMAMFLAAIKGNLSELLNACKITNPKSIELITLVVKELDAMINSISINTDSGASNSISSPQKFPSVNEKMITNPYPFGVEHPSINVEVEHPLAAYTATNPPVPILPHLQQ